MGALDAVVQFLRNGSSCMKDLGLFSDTFLHDPSMTSEFFFELPQPFNETTPLEAFNSFCQLYAFVTITIAGLHLINESGWGKLNRIKNLERLRRSSQKANLSVSDKIVDQSINQEKSNAFRDLLLGGCTFSIGIAFFWFFAHCWHVTAKNWLGGTPGLMLAVDVIEVTFVPYLWYYVLDGQELLNKASRMEEFASSLKQSKGNLNQELLNNETFSWIVREHWAPFWSCGWSLFEVPPDDIFEQQRLQKEIDIVKAALDEFLSQGNEFKKKKAILDDAAQRLESDALLVRLEGYREYLYFVLNFIAFYGFMMGCLSYYFDNEDAQPAYVRNLKLGMSNAAAEWRGYFFGELMWTIQPIVCLTSPFFLNRMKYADSKLKTA